MNVKFVYAFLFVIFVAHCSAFEFKDIFGKHGLLSKLFKHKSSSSSSSSHKNAGGCNSPTSTTTKTTPKWLMAAASRLNRTAAAFVLAISQGASAECSAALGEHRAWDLLGADTRLWVQGKAGINASSSRAALDWKELSGDDKRMLAEFRVEVAHKHLHLMSEDMLALVDSTREWLNVDTCISDRLLGRLVRKQASGLAEKLHGLVEKVHNGELKLVEKAKEFLAPVLKKVAVVKKIMKMFG